MIKYEEFWWIRYLGDEHNYDLDKVGKWMYFFHGEEGAAFADKVCKAAVENDIVKEAKYSNPATLGMSPNATSPDSGVACFYLNVDDKEGHKKTINFFIENNMIKKTKAGKFYNIPFKFDQQTLANEYGDDFKAKLNLSDFIDLTTGEWIADK